MITTVLFVSLIVFLVLNVPVGIAIGLSSWTSVLLNPRLSDSFIVQQLISGSDSFPIMAIPLFILAGELMAAGGVSKRILNVCSAFFGRITGGLAIVTVVVCMFFAAVSGSGPATVAAVGTMVIPSMLEKGYSKSFSLACVACAGCIGVIIPPSIPMVIYGVSTSTSISAMFLAGFAPGIIIGTVLCLVCYFYCKKQGWKGDDRKYTFKEKMKVVWDSKFALIEPVIILGGIYGGIFPPTEAAAVAVAFGFFSDKIGKGYQWYRILAVIDPENTTGWAPSEAVWKNIIYQQQRGEIAIGSGGIFGNGLFGDRYYSVPNAHNDFILSWIGNSAGFVGCCVVLGVLFALVVKTFATGARSEDLLGSYICAGIGGALMAQIAVNVGMNLRLLPVIGVTLPFYSAGGSSVLMLYICVGLVLSVYSHNTKSLFG